MSNLNIVLWAIPAVAFLMAFAMLAWQYRRTISNNLERAEVAAPLALASPARRAGETPANVSRRSERPAASVPSHDPLSRENFARICGKFRIREISVLPSAGHVRGSAKANLGILVEFGNGVSLDSSIVFRLRQELFMALGRQVDLVCKNVEQARRPGVLAQARVLYAA